MTNYDNRPLEARGLSIERQCAVEILEYLGADSKSEQWYEDEDYITEMIIDIVDRYLIELQVQVA